MRFFVLACLISVAVSKHVQRCEPPPDPKCEDNNQMRCPGPPAKECPTPDMCIPMQGKLIQVSRETGQCHCHWHWHFRTPWQERCPLSSPLPNFLRWEGDDVPWSIWSQWLHDSRCLCSWYVLFVMTLMKTITDWIVNNHLQLEKNVLHQPCARASVEILPQIPSVKRTIKWDVPVQWPRIVHLRTCAFQKKVMS